MKIEKTKKRQCWIEFGSKGENRVRKTMNLVMELPLRLLSWWWGHWQPWLRGECERERVSVVTLRDLKQRSQREREDGNGNENVKEKKKECAWNQHWTEREEGGEWVVWSYNEWTNQSRSVLSKYVFSFFFCFLFTFIYLVFIITTTCLLIKKTKLRQKKLKKKGFTRFRSWAISPITFYTCENE
jgi:hypothetical protein